MQNIKEILQDYISSRIPRKVTNVIYSMFNGIQASFEMFENRLNIVKRERNILTAQHITSLRHLAAQNGFEPVLKVPSKGILFLKINPKLFNRCGYPLFITPYSVFTNKTNKLTYYYNSNVSLRISDNNVYVPVVEGTIKNIPSFQATEEYIQRTYLPENNIAEGSILIMVNGIKLLEVKSFFDNDGINDNKQFLVKFSNNPQQPIVIYIKGLIQYDSVEISYRLTNGELGNIFGNKHSFEIENFIDNQGIVFNPADDEITITNATGFELGSNGTDSNSLRSAIGYNHGKTLLFDNTSYNNFINKYSTVLLQKIENPTKTINTIFVSKKQSLNTGSDNKTENINQYKQIINTGAYYLSKSEKQNLSSIISEFEYCLTSHNLVDSTICKYGFQLIMSSKNDIDKFGLALQNLLYVEFTKFLFDKYHIINVELLFETFMKENNIKFDYDIFNQLIENEKIKNKTDISTSYIIKHEKELPILCGDFNICDSNFTTYKLFSDINIVIKN